MPSLVNLRTAATCAGYCEAVSYVLSIAGDRLRPLCNVLNPMARSDFPCAAKSSVMTWQSLVTDADSGLCTGGSAMVCSVHPMALPVHLGMGGWVQKMMHLATIFLPRSMHLHWCVPYIVCDDICDTHVTWMSPCERCPLLSQGHGAKHCSSPLGLPDPHSAFSCCLQLHW